MSTSITELKAQLGLNIPRTHSETDPAVVLELFKGFAQINDRYADLRPPQVRGSDAIRNDARKLFEKLGPNLWPDLDKEASIPSWLSCPSGDFDQQRQNRRFYSNSIHRGFLADRFYDLVCSKLNQYHTNTQKRKRKTNPILDTEDHLDSEEAESLEHRLHTDSSVCQNATDDNHNTFVRHSTFGTINIPSEDSIPPSVDRESTQPTTAPPHPPAPALNDHSLMGDTPSKLVEADPKFQHRKLKKFMEQQGRTNRANSHRLDDTLPDFEVTPAGVRMISPSAHGMSQSPPRYMDQSERPLAHSTHNGKRPLEDGTRGRKIKRNKNHPDVQTAKPSLLVVLKLTRGKGISDRPKTVPPQQPRVSIPSVEADEIAVRHSPVLASRHSTTASDPEIGDEGASIQQGVPHQNPLDDISDVAMKAPEDLNDTGSAYDTTGPAISADNTIRPSSATPHQSHEAPKQWDSQVMAEFRKIWSGEAYEVVNEILTTSLSKHTPAELVFEILLPKLRQIRDQLPSATVQDDPLSTSNDAREIFTPQALNPGRRESASLEQSIPTLQTARDAEVAEEFVPPIDTGKSQESPRGLVIRADNAEEHMSRSGSFDPVAAAKTLGKKRAIVGDDMITDKQLNKTDPGNASFTNTLGASKVAEDANPMDTSYEHSELVQHINLTLLLDRRDGSDPKDMGTFGIGDICKSRDLFDAIQRRCWWKLKQDEEISRAIITENDDHATDGPKTEMGFLKGDMEDRSWDTWLVRLRKFHERERVDIRKDLVAKLFVTGRSDWKT